jgi:hypothetical protein
MSSVAPSQSRSARCQAWCEWCLSHGFGDAATTVCYRGCRELSLSNNQLTGTIPKGIATLLKGLGIDLSYNLLTGNATLFVDKFGAIFSRTTASTPSSRLQTHPVDEHDSGRCQRRTADGLIGGSATTTSLCSQCRWDHRDDQTVCHRRVGP